MIYSQAEARLNDLVEDILFLHNSGANLHGICRQIKVKPDTLYNRLRRTGRLHVWERIRGDA